MTLGGEEKENFAQSENANRPRSDLREKISSIDEIVRGLLTHKKDKEEEDERIKKHLTNIENAHNKFSFDITKLNNLVALNTDRIKFGQFNHGNETESKLGKDSSVAARNEEIAIKQGIMNDMQNTLQGMKQDMQQLDLRHKHALEKLKNEDQSNIKYQLNESNIREIVEKKLQDVYKMYSLEELNKYKTKMDEQHQQVISILGALEGKYNTVKNKVNCVKCNQSIYEHLGAAVSNIDAIPVKIPFKQPLSNPTNDLLQPQMEKLNEKWINLSNRVNSVEFLIKDPSTKKEMEELRSLVINQVSNIQRIVSDYQNKSEETNDNQQNILELPPLSSKAIDILQDKQISLRTELEKLKVIVKMEGLNILSVVDDLNKKIVSKGYNTYKNDEGETLNSLKVIKI